MGAQIVMVKEESNRNTSTVTMRRSICDFFSAIAAWILSQFDFPPHEKLTMSAFEAAFAAQQSARQNTVPVPVQGRPLPPPPSDAGRYASDAIRRKRPQRTTDVTNSSAPDLNDSNRTSPPQSQ